MNEEFYMKYMKEDSIAEYIKKRNWSKKQFNTYMQIIKNYIENNDINKDKLKELKSFFNLNTNFWCFIEWVNCYAYALGIDLPPECFNIKSYYPGYFYEVINKTKVKQSKDNYIERLEMDLKSLEYDYRIVSPEEEIGCYEWKIAFFNNVRIDSDFHFLRQGSDGLWYHKQGFQRNSIPTNKDDDGNIITNPLEASLNKWYKYNRCYSLRFK